MQKLTLFEPVFDINTLTWYLLQTNIFSFLKCMHFVFSDEKYTYGCNAQNQINFDKEYH